MQQSWADPSYKLDEFRSRQERLRDEIEDIRKQLAEKKKPWYQQPTTLMSIAGTLFAVLSGLYSIRSGQKQDINKNAAELQTIVEQLLQLRSDEWQDATTSKNDPGYNLRSSNRNTKRLGLLEQAGFKIKAAKSQVSPSLFISLAIEAENDGDYKTAKDYFSSAIRESQPRTPAKVGALLSLATLCLTDGKTQCKQGEGKTYYLKALDEQPSDSDNMHYQKGQVLSRIALLAHQTDPNDKEAADYFRRAELEEEQINPLNGNRQQLNQYITNARALMASISAPKSMSFKAPETFLGVWRLSYRDNHTRTGVATFVSTPTFPFYGAMVDIFQDHKLSEKQSGGVLVIDPTSLRLDWAGSGGILQTGGYTIFRLDVGGKKLMAEQFRFGEARETFTLTR